MVGLPGQGSPYDFSKELCELVDPDLYWSPILGTDINNPIPDVNLWSKSSETVVLI